MAEKNQNQPRTPAAKTRPAPAASTYEQLIAQLDAIEALYKALDSLRQPRRALIDAEEPALLLDELARRDRVVEDLQRADESLDPVNEAWESASDDATPSERQAVLAKTGAISRLAAKVAADDEEDNQRMVRRRAEIATELSGLSISRAATAAYSEPNKASPRFQDREV